MHEQGLLTAFQEIPQAEVADSLVLESEMSFPTGRDTGHAEPCILGLGPGQEGMEWPPGVPQNTFLVRFRLAPLCSGLRALPLSLIFHHGGSRHPLASQQVVCRAEGKESFRSRRTFL